MILAIIAFFYLAGYVVSWGMQFAAWQREFPTIAFEDRWSDFTSAVCWSFLWPLTLPMVLFLCHYHGFKWWPDVPGKGNESLFHYLKRRRRKE
jgi:hypothetical protein